MTQHHYHHHSTGLTDLLGTLAVWFWVFAGLWGLIVLVFTFPWILPLTLVGVAAVVMAISHAKRR